MGFILSLTVKFKFNKHSNIYLKFYQFSYNILYCSFLVFPSFSTLGTFGFRFLNFHMYLFYCYPLFSINHHVCFYIRIYILSFIFILCLILSTIINSYTFVLQTFLGGINLSLSFSPLLVFHSLFHFL